MPIRVTTTYCYYYLLLLTTNYYLLLHDDHQGPCSCWVIPTARRSAPGADGRYAIGADGTSVLPQPRKSSAPKAALQGAAQDERSRQMMHSLGAYLELTLTLTLTLTLFLTLTLNLTINLTLTRTLTLTLTRRVGAATACASASP